MRRTLYRKIYDDLVFKMRSGVLQSGDRLPSTRELAKLYKCHRFTVMKVYQDLSAEDWILSAQGSRYVVSEKAPLTFSQASKKSTQENDLSKIARAVPDVDLERIKYPLEFWGGQPDLRLFPKDEFRRVLSSALRRTRPDQLNYGLATGLSSCLKEVSGYLRKSRNLLNRELIMTNGSQEALLLVFQAFGEPGCSIAIERKGYPPAWRLFESLGAKLIPIEVDSEGLDTDDLEKKARKHDFKLIYVTPLHQYPTTVTMSPRRRHRLIQIAEQRMIPILEDDYDHEFHYIGPPPAPLSAETNLGIYVCSFSKVLFPGARLGVIACDKQAIRSLSYQKHIVSRQTDCLTQIGLSAWIREGGFERHLRRMRRLYEGRSDFMQKQLQKLKSDSDLSWLTPTGGMSIWVDLKKDSKKVAGLAKKRGVFFQHESSMDYLGCVGTHLRIGFAGVNEKEIAEGIGVLKSLI